MMAVESLLELEFRPEAAQQHVEALISYTSAATELTSDDKSSIVGSLRWLMKESIGQAGRKLARTLGDRRYVDKKPADFFTYAYSMRSRLVHGHSPRPSDSEIGSLVGDMERYVSDLLSGSLLNAPI